MEQLVSRSKHQYIEFWMGLISSLLMGAFLLLGHLIGFTAYHGGFGLWLDGQMPFFSLLGGFAFLIPLLLHWRQRQAFAWLSLPAVTLFTLFLIFGNCGAALPWGSWHYLWPVLPIGIGLGLYAVYLIGGQARWLLLVATTVTALSIWVFGFLTAFSGELIYRQPMLPFLLMLCGVALVVMNFIKARQY